MSAPQPNMFIPAEVKRQIVNEMADWLEQRHFKVTASYTIDPNVAQAATQGWAEGYRRAIHELRWAAAEPVQVPDDISEIE